MTYKYDVFISYSRYRLWPSWVKNNFLPLFEHYLGEQLADWLGNNRDISIFLDERMETGSDWPKEIGSALSKSRVLVALWSKQYFNSTWCMAELTTMQAREEQCGTTRLIVPASIFDGASFPKIALQRQWIDLSEYANPRLAKGGITHEQFSSALMKWTEDIASAIYRAPDYDPEWEKIAIENSINTFNNEISEPKQKSVPSMGETI